MYCSDCESVSLDMRGLLWDAESATPASYKMRKEYRELLARIAREIKPDELEIMKYLCTDFIPYIKSTQMEPSSTNCLMEVFDFFCKLEKHEKLGIDDLDRLKDMLEHLGEEELVLEVTEFQFQRSEYLSSLGASHLERGDINQTTRNEQGTEEEEQPPREDKKTKSEEEDKEGQPRTVDQISRGTMVMRCVPLLAGGVWAAGSAYILNRYKNDPKTLVNVVSGVVLPTGMAIKRVFHGSINFLLQATDLNSLKELWKSYEKGQLKEQLEQVMVTEELKNLANGQQIEFVVTISEAEYRNACLDLMIAQSKAQTLCKRIISHSPLQASRSLPDLTSLDATHDLSRDMHFGKLLNSARMKKKIIHASAGESPSNLLRKETVLSLLQFIDSIKSKIKFFPGFELHVQQLSGYAFGIKRYLFDEDEHRYYYHDLISNPDYKLLLDLLQEVNTVLDGRSVLILPQKTVKDLVSFRINIKKLKLDDINWMDREHALGRMRRHDFLRPFGATAGVKKKLNLLTQEMKELAAFLVKEFNLDSSLLKDTQEEVGSRKRKMPFPYDYPILRPGTEKLAEEKTTKEASKMGKGQKRILISPNEVSLETGTSR